MYLWTKMAKGFTLIELTIVIILFSVLTTVAFMIFLVGIKSWDSSLNRANVRQDANFAIERMVREIAQATSITSAKADEIEIVVDLDSDSINETVLFDVTANALNRTEDASAVTLASNVQSFILAYRDVDDSSMSIPADVSSQGKRDNIRVVIPSLIMERGDDTINLSSSVYTRNQGL